MSEGRLIASGRDGDIFEYGPGKVLRRTRDGRVIDHEARIMQYVAEHGYPLPRIDEVRAGGTEIVMERIDGPLMVDIALRRPWTLPRHARTLADLHDQLHEIRAPDWLERRAGPGDRVLHLDLHPLNVIMSHRGPVVIDWGNTSVGDPLLDVGFTYVLLTCPDAPVPRAVGAVLKPFRQAVARTFARRFRGPELNARIVEAAEWKMRDPHFSPREVEKCRRLASRLRTR